MASIPIKKFAFRILVFSIILAAVTILCQWILPVGYCSPALPFIVLFFTILSLLTMYIIMRKEGGRDSKRFISSYLLSRIIKMMSCMLFLFIYIFINPDDKWPFAGGFILIYFAFATFEVFLLKKE